MQDKYDAIDAKLDLKKAIVPQLAKLTKEEYMLLVDRPQYLETTDSIILYENPWKDWWVRSDISLNQRVLIPLCLATFAYSIWLRNQENKDGSLLDDVLYCFGVYMLGAIGWTMLEYKEHRFTLHNFDSIPDNFTEE